MTNNSTRGTGTGATAGNAHGTDTTNTADTADTDVLGRLFPDASDAQTVELAQAAERAANAETERIDLDDDRSSGDGVIDDAYFETRDAAASPRIRWAAIAWGIIVSVAAIFVLMTAGSTERREAFFSWASGLSAGGIVVIVVLAVGGLILLLGALSLTRRKPAAERARDAGIPRHHGAR